MRKSYANAWMALQLCLIPTLNWESYLVVLHSFGWSYPLFLVLVCSRNGFECDLNEHNYIFCNQTKTDRYKLYNLIVTFTKLSLVMKVPVSFFHRYLILIINCYAHFYIPCTFGEDFYINVFINEYPWCFSLQMTVIHLLSKVF